MDQQTAVAALESVITGRGSSWMVPEDMNPAMGDVDGKGPRPVSHGGLLFRPGCHHGETGTGEATTMMQTVDSLARSLGLPGSREIEEVKHWSCPSSSHSV